MSDAGWRRWEREWEANPGDLDALEAAIAGRRRAGIGVPGPLLAARRFPGREFDSVLSLRVGAWLLDGRAIEVGRTPRGGMGVTIPPHNAWWIQPETSTPLGVRDFSGVDSLAQELRRHSVPGLRTRRLAITDGVLGKLASCPSLSHLDLGACERLTEHGLKHLLELERLYRLELLDCEHVEDAGLAILTRAPDLSRLALKNAARVTDVGLSYLGELDRLTHLALSGSPISDEGVAQLRGLEQLEELSLERCGITDGSLASIRGRACTRPG